MRGRGWEKHTTTRQETYATTNHMRPVDHHGTEEERRLALHALEFEDLNNVQVVGVELQIITHVEDDTKAGNALDLANILESIENQSTRLLTATEEDNINTPWSRQRASSQRQTGALVPTPF